MPYDGRRRETYSTKQRPANNSTVTDKLDCGIAVARGLLEALLALRRETFPIYELGRFKGLVALKMEAICSSETFFLTRAARYKVPKISVKKSY
jgi:hypothetical protein